MKTILKTAAFITALCIASQGAWAGDEEATKTIATIIASLNHFPNAEQKQELQQITESDASEETKTIARVLHDLQHKPSAEDNKTLAAIIDEESSTDAEKQLAAIIMNINHKPSAEAQEQLKKLM